jgi:hypothetical protein
VAKINDGASSAFVAIPGLVTIQLPDLQVEAKEDRAFSASKIKQFEPGLGEYSEVAFTMDYTDAQHARFRALAHDAVEIKIYPPDPDGAGAELAEVATVAGFFTKIGGPRLERGAEMRMEHSLKVNSVTYADAPNNSPVGV